MTLTQQIAKDLRDVYFGGNWTASDLQSHLADVTWEEATKRVYGVNTIAILTNHLHYYVKGVTKVLEGGPLELKDKLSFSHDPISSQEDWDSMLQTIWNEAEHFASLVEVLPDSIVLENFLNGKYGNYYRNLEGIVQHVHYHLGQIVVLKRVLREKRG